MNQDTRWIAVFSALMLLIGIFIGIAMDRLLFRPPPHPPSISTGAWMQQPVPAGARLFLRRLMSELDLTEEQRAEVDAVFQRNLPLLREARGDRESFRAARRKLSEELDEVLTGEQRRKLERLRRHERALGRERRGDRPAPDSSPGGTE